MNKKEVLKWTNNKKRQAMEGIVQLKREKSLQGPDAHYGFADTVSLTYDQAVIDVITELESLLNASTSSSR